MLAKERIEIRSQEISNCYFCGMEGKELYIGLKDRIFNAPGIWNFKQCQNSCCGLVWIDPMPLEDDIDLAYKDYFTHQVSERLPNRSISQTAMHYFRIALTAVTCLNSMKKARKYQYLENIPVGKLLEVGCGAGDYLNLMRNRGWDVEGVDFDAEAAKNASRQFGVKVHSGQLKDINYAACYFDAITINHAIEHIFDPVSLLQECRRILKPTGRLVVITPNLKSYGHLKFKSSWFALDPPRHIFLFSPLSLKLLGEKAGFADVVIFTSPVHAEFVFRGSLSIRKAGRFDMQGKISSLNSFEKLKATFMHFKEALRIKSLPDIGEEVIMICRIGEGK